MLAGNSAAVDALLLHHEAQWMCSITEAPPTHTFFPLLLSVVFPAEIIPFFLISLAALSGLKCIHMCYTAAAEQQKF